MFILPISYGMNERRRERISSFVRETIPYFFQEECAFPKGVFVSVLHIEVVKSGSRANVFASVFPDNAKEAVAKELHLRENEATRFMRGRIANKYSPAIRFHVR